MNAINIIQPAQPLALPAAAVQEKAQLTRRARWAVARCVGTCVINIDFVGTPDKRIQGICMLEQVLIAAHKTMLQ